MPRHLSVLGWLISGIVASPHHDELQARTRLHRAPQLYGSTVLRDRRLDNIGTDDCPTVHARPFESLRIGYEMVASNDIDQSIKDHVETEILARAIAYWQKALKVRRVTAPLRADHDPSQCSMPQGGQIWTCQVANAPTCGVDGTVIPAKFLSSSVGSGYQMCNTCGTLQQGDGAVGYDFFMFVDIKDSASCAGDTQAYATSCVQDQCDRPIFAAVTFCLSKVSLDLGNTTQQVGIAVHEIAHALAFSSSLFKYFRNADGSPKLARLANDATRVQDSVAWTCSETSYTYPDAQNGNRDYVDLQAKGLVTTMDERGIGTCPCPLGQTSMTTGCIVPQEPHFRTPSCVVKLITPKVVEKVREHFDCNTLAGAELENQATSGCTIIGSHWEARLFLTEVMVAVHSGLEPVFISAVTLALFEDSGWYQPDYSWADTLVPNVHWGYKQGCSFAKDACLSSGTTSFDRFWCSSDTATACSLDRHGVGQCSTLDYGSAASLPSAVGSYFAGNIVGNMAEADYCPFYSTVVTNRNCLSTESIYLPYTNVNYMREVFGATSRCLDSTLHADVTAAGGAVYQAAASDFVAAQPSCYEVVCAADGASYEVKLSDRSTLGTCSSSGQALTKADLQGQVTCAAPAELCGVQPSKMATVIPLPTTTTTPSASGLPDSALIDGAMHITQSNCRLLRWTLTLLALVLAASGK